jgi:hypothetical protein
MHILLDAGEAREQRHDEQRDNELDRFPISAPELFVLVSRGELPREELL